MLEFDFACMVGYPIIRQKPELPIDTAYRDDYKRRKTIKHMRCPSLVGTAHETLCSSVFFSLL